MRLDLFHLSERGTTWQRELLGGTTTFMTMGYIIFVQSTILQAAGMDPGAVMVATCLASALATFSMGLLANYPIALAPGMGHNVFFSYTVVLTLGYTWQQALGATFISGTLFLLLSCFRAAREPDPGSAPQPQECHCRGYRPAHLASGSGVEWHCHRSPRHPGGLGRLDLGSCPALPVRTYHHHCPDNERLARSHPDRHPPESAGRTLERHGPLRRRPGSDSVAGPNPVPARRPWRPRKGHDFNHPADFPVGPLRHRRDALGCEPPGWSSPVRWEPSPRP